MASWFSKELPLNTRIVTSASRFTSEEIVLEFLKHYIQNLNARPDADWKLMLMNNHESYLTTEFIDLINENHIRSYPLIPHLTHCMQSLNVDIFNSYKHWHIKAIREAIAMSFIEYSINQFLTDLNKIIRNACKVTNILHAFRDIDMWSINVKRCVTQFKKFHPDSSQIKELKLSLLRQMKSWTAMKTSLDQWNEKIQKFMQWSDSLRANEFNEFLAHSKEIFANQLVKETKLKMWQAKRRDKIKNRIISRKRLRIKIDQMRLIKEDAKLAMIEKLNREKVLKQKKMNANFMRMWRMKRDEVPKKDIEARKIEKAHLKQINALKSSKHQFSSICWFSSLIRSVFEKKSTRCDWSSKQKSLQRNDHVRSFIRLTKMMKIMRWLWMNHDCKEISSLLRMMMRRMMREMMMKRMMKRVMRKRIMRDMRSMRRRLRSMQSMKLLMKFCLRIFWMILLMMNEFFRLCVVSFMTWWWCVEMMKNDDLFSYRYEEHLQKELRNSFENISNIIWSTLLERTCMKFWVLLIECHMYECFEAFGLTSLFLFDVIDFKGLKMRWFCWFSIIHFALIIHLLWPPKSGPLFFGEPELSEPTIKATSI
jgi:hypothetical protein